MKKWLLFLSIAGIASNAGMSAVDLTDLKDMARFSFSLYLFGKIYPSLSTETKGIINASILAGATVGIGIAKYERRQRKNELRKNYLIKRYRLDENITNYNFYTNIKKSLPGEMEQMALGVAVYDAVSKDIETLKHRKPAEIGNTIKDLSTEKSDATDFQKAKAHHWAKIIRSYPFIYRGYSFDPIAKKLNHDRLTLEQYINPPMDTSPIKEQHWNDLAEHVTYNKNKKKEILNQFLGESFEIDPKTDRANQELLVAHSIAHNTEYVTRRGNIELAHRGFKKETYPLILQKYSIDKL